MLWVALLAGGLIGAILIRKRSGERPARPAMAATSAPPSTAYRPALAARHAGAPTAPRTGSSAAPLSIDDVPPELRDRLRASMHVVAISDTAGADPSAAPPPPLSPQAEAELQRALTAWTADAQRALDGCVGRPAPARQPVELVVAFGPMPAAPGAAGTSSAPPQLLPALVAVPPHELARLWRDTDPDELQICIDRLRIMPVSVPALAAAAPRAIPTTQQRVVVQL